MRVRAVIDLVVVLPALWIAGHVVGAFAGRWRYPYDLEWMEGGMLAHAWRIENGLPVYALPDASWIPYIYPPGYPALLAALGLPLGGASPPLGRAVSIAATLAAVGALVHAGRRWGRTWTGGALAGALYLALYPDSGAFYDLVRPDALGVALAGWAIVLAPERSRRAQVAAGLLLAAAFAAKQNLALFGLPMALGLWAAHGWRAAAAFTAASAGPALVYVVVLQLHSGGHFLSTVLGVAAAHPSANGRLLPGAVAELGAHLPVLGPALAVTLAAVAAPRAGQGGARRLGVSIGVAVALAVALGWLLPSIASWGFESVQRPRQLGGFGVTEAAWWGALGAGGAASVALLWGGRRRRSRWPYAIGVCTAGLLGAGLMRAHHGGFINVYMPAHFVLCLAAGVGVGLVRLRWPSLPVAALSVLPLAVELGRRGPLDVEPLVPTLADVAVGDAFVEALRGCEGPVLSPIAPWLPTYAGHDPGWHLIALWDIHHRDGPYHAQVADVKAAAASHRWGCVVMGTGKPLGYGISDAYARGVEVPVVREPGRRGPPPFAPRTGWRERPGSIWTPKEE